MGGFERYPGKPRPNLQGTKDTSGTRLYKARKETSDLGGGHRGEKKRQRQVPQVRKINKFCACMDPPKVGGDGFCKFKKFESVGGPDRGKKGR